MAGFHVDIILCLLPGLIVCSTDVNFQEELLERIQALEKQGQAQAEKMHKLEMRLEKQDEKLVQQQITISAHQERIKELENTVKELQPAKEPNIKGGFRKYKGDGGQIQPIPVNATEERNGACLKDGCLYDSTGPYIATVTRKVNTNHPRRPPLTYNVKSIRTILDAVKQRRVLLNAEGPVAFHAVIKTKHEVPHIGTNQNIVFPDILVNLGGGYHNLHGVFIAPTPGIYIFSTSIMSYSSGHVEIYVHLMKNGNVLANAYAHGDSGRHDQGSVTVVTQLATGDEVWVSLYDLSDASLWGDYFDSFMGCLVYPM